MLSVWPDSETEWAALRDQISSELLALRDSGWSALPPSAWVARTRDLYLALRERGLDTSSADIAKSARLVGIAGTMRRSRGFSLKTSASIVAVLRARNVTAPRFDGVWDDITPASLFRFHWACHFILRQTVATCVSCFSQPAKRQGGGPIDRLRQMYGKHLGPAFANFAKADLTAAQEEFLGAALLELAELVREELPDYANQRDDNGALAAVHAVFPDVVRRVLDRLWGAGGRDSGRASFSTGMQFHAVVDPRTGKT